MIQIEEMIHKIEGLQIKEGDYVIFQPTDIYFGAGIYEIKFRTEKRLCNCIEQNDKSIKAVEISGTNTETISASEFTQRVERKVVGTISLDLNVAQQTMNDLRAQLSK